MRRFSNRRRLAGWVLCLAALLLFAAAAPAQDANQPPSFDAGALFGSEPSAQAGLADIDQSLSVTAGFTVKPQQPGDEKTARQAAIFVTADVAPGWHVYSLTQPPGGPIATKITVEPSPGKDYAIAGPFTTVAVPEKQTLAAFGNLMVETHHGKPTWWAPLRIAPGADPASLVVTGSLRAQPCTETSCLPPKNYPFTAKFSPGVSAPALAYVMQTSVTERLPEGEKVSSGATAFDAGELKIDANEKLAKTHIAIIIVMSFAGGFILNIMPCVLPVIGLKLLTFIEQSGHSRARAFWLNVWYSLGLMSVFLVLATLAVAAGLGWGSLFQFSGFTVTLTAVVFVMALSFFDVWEIPIPGFAGRGKAGEWGQREGAVGALAKGVLTTFLATPCSAPLLAPALTWSATRSPWEVYMVFFFVGLGMAFPYLLIGAFPRLIAFLPKPGQWMDTFKHIMGFVLLATVAYLLTTLNPAYVVPTVALMFGLWGACWWVGRTPPTADGRTKLRRWLQALIFTCVVIVVAYPGIDEIAPRRFSFGGVYDIMNHRLERLVEQRLAKAGRAQTKETTEDEITWTPFTRRRFEELTGPRRPVLVDFTADWCMTCKTLEATVLDTPAVRKALAENKVVTMQADWTQRDVEITEILDSLVGSAHVPVIAVFPPDRPNQPVIFDGGYTAGGLIDAINKSSADESSHSNASSSSASSSISTSE